MILLGGNLLSLDDLYKLEDVELRNSIYSDLSSGNCIVKIPSFDSYSNLSRSERDLMRKSYKVGFLFDLLTHFYPDSTNVYKYKIINREYHLFLTHKRLLDLYKKYYLVKYGRFKDIK